jgi:hypothetical protein
MIVEANLKLVGHEECRKWFLAPSPHLRVSVSDFSLCAILYACPPVGRRCAILRVRVMTNYLVQTYRKANNNGRVVGVVEEVGVEGNKAFSNLDELWTILNSSKAETGKLNKPNKPNKLNEPNEPNEPNKPNKLNKP